jgi:DNA-binding NarL/FixJ family response regulator
MRVLLVDDHHLIRAGLRELILRLKEVERVDEAGSAEEALSLLRQSDYDVLVSDISMPGRSGLELVADVREKFPGTRSVVLSMHLGDEFVQRALKSGASGYLLKDAATAELGLALASVMRGEVYLSPKAASKLVSSSIGGTAGTASKDSVELAPRQKEILCMIARGLSTKEIAFELQLSAKTVETHRARLMERLGIRDIAGLVRYALRNGLVE